MDLVKWTDGDTSIFSKAIDQLKRLRLERVCGSLEGLSTRKRQAVVGACKARCRAGGIVAVTIHPPQTTESLVVLGKPDALSPVYVHVDSVDALHRYFVSFVRGHQEDQQEEGDVFETPEKLPKFVRYRNAGRRSLLCRVRFSDLANMCSHPWRFSTCALQRHGASAHLRFSALALQHPCVSACPCCAATCV